MNRKEAIKILEVMDARYVTFDEKERQALAIAIEALKTSEYMKSSFYATEKFQRMSEDQEIMHTFNPYDF